MQFKYELSGHGWAKGFIELHSQKCEFNPSYLTDAFGDLLQGLLDLINGENRTTFLWDEEPRGLQWTLILHDNHTLSLTITEFMDTFVDLDEQEGKVVVDTTCHFPDFIKMVINEADHLLKKYGIVGYRKSWIEHDFPLSNYLQLKYFIAKGEKFPLQAMAIDKKRGNELITSDLKQELQYLIQNFDFE